VGDHIYVLTILHLEYNIGTHVTGGWVGTRTGLSVMKVRKPVHLPKVLHVIIMQVAPGPCFKPWFFSRERRLKSKV